MKNKIKTTFNLYLKRSLLNNDHLKLMTIIANTLFNRYFIPLIV